MPNHFHFLIQIKDENEIKQQLPEAFPKFQTLGKLVSKQFANLFSSYTQAFNKQQGRMGSLFMKNFKRIKITDENYLINLVQYIHFNPVEANLCNKPFEWNHSSYNVLISDRATDLKRKELMDWFNDLENFKYMHSFIKKVNGIEL